MNLDEFKCDHDIRETCVSCDGFQPETLEAMKKENECPRCSEPLVFPRGLEAYCEECGYPEEGL